MNIANSRSTQALATGKARLWALLVGVNQYQDPALTCLRYSATDCQGLAEAIATAAQRFPNKVIQTYHDWTLEAPTLATLESSLQAIAEAAQPEDTVLFYFSGHGILAPQSQQAILCLADTQRGHLAETGLGVKTLLQFLDRCPARQQLIWLDACHSGDFSLRGARGDFTASLLDPTSYLVTALRKRTTQGRGLYALLSCDQGQQSWEFPKLGHGVFTYYLMRGLRGEAADAQGIIEADGLYRYVYYQTLQYIDKLNQQVRWINQQQRSSGDPNLQPEYSLQTPKRIVEGVGELILGLRASAPKWEEEPRQALILEGLPHCRMGSRIGPVLERGGGYELQRRPSATPSESEVRSAIHRCLGYLRQPQPSVPPTHPGPLIAEAPLLSLLYLRGQVEGIEDGEAWLVLDQGVRLSRSWLRQVLRHAGTTQQIVILDCPGALSLADWIEDLKLNTQQGQCLIAAASPASKPEQFAETFLEVLAEVDPPMGLPAASLISQLQDRLTSSGTNLWAWLSGTQGVIEVLPAGMETVAPATQIPRPEDPTAIAVAPTQVQSSWAPLQLSPQQSAYLETLLQELVGPIAPTLLRQAAARATTLQALVEGVKGYLPQQYQREFTQRALSLPKLEPSAGAAQPQPRSSAPLPLDAAWLHHCEQQLTDCVGPVAALMIQRTLKSYPHLSLQDFVEMLAQEIPDTVKAQGFRQQLLL